MQGTELQGHTEVIECQGRAADGGCLGRLGPIVALEPGQTGASSDIDAEQNAVDRFLPYIPAVSEVVDLVVLPHTLELARDPHRTLAVAARQFEGATLEGQGDVRAHIN